MFNVFALLSAPGRLRYDKRDANARLTGFDSYRLDGVLSNCAGQNGRLLFVYGEAKTQSSTETQSLTEDLE